MIVNLKVFGVNIMKKCRGRRNERKSFLEDTP